MNSKSFAAFIITFERADILPATIKKILEQTIAPQKILIVDNSITDKTEILINSLNDARISYYRVGYNAGPAGGAYHGLKQLGAEGFEWIYWGDDNDPPNHAGVFEDIFKIQDSGIERNAIGILGHRGGKFDRMTGRTSNLRNSELKGIIKVDFVTGGQHMIINADVIRQGVLPTEKLFFGFEELDFCLNIKAHGKEIYICGDYWLQARMKSGNSDPDYRWKGTNVGKAGSLWRQYYSIRNMLFIQHKNKMYIAMLLLISKLIIKSLLGFKYGLRYGWDNLQIHFLGLYHFLIGKFGMQDLSKFRK